MENNERKEQRLSRGEVIAMLAIVAMLLCVALYANWQHARRDKIEKVTVTPLTPAPTASPRKR